MFEGRFAIVTTCIVASGATALAFVTFLGAIFPQAPNDAARLHLLLAGMLPFFGFVCAVLCAGAANLFRNANAGDFWVALPQLAACLINLVILFSVVNQTAAALGEWFDEVPAGPPGIDWVIRISLGASVILLVSGLISAGVKFIRSRR